jgi:predicted hotdog family 3-hydroxylacyl-ACP dehydratase
MRLNRERIEAMLPHRGAMCLLDEVLSWDSETIRCRTASHRSPENPLRGEAGLGVACGIEYAAQAMALHAALSMQGDAMKDQPRRAPAGALASVRSVRMSGRWLDGGDQDLIVDAQLISGDPDRAMYSFLLASGERELLSGRATVILNIGRTSMGPLS